MHRKLRLLLSRSSVLSTRKGRTEEAMDKFSNRKDISSIKRVNICYRQFSEEGLKRTKLLYEYKPVPTIIPVTREKENLLPNGIFETNETPKKPPRQKIFQEDQMKPLKNLHVIKYFDDINKEKMKSLDA